MEDQDGGLGIDELAERAGTPVRTIRYYIAEGLLPGPGARGKAATYGDDHLTRLRLIRRLVEQRVPLADIRERLARLTADEVVALLADEDRHAAELRRVAESTSPKEYIAALLRQAQRGRQQKPAAAAAIAPAPVVPAPAPSAASAPAGAGAPKAGAAPSLRARSAKAAADLDAAAGEPWLRLPLVPGVELFVSAEAKERHRAMLERILRAAVEPRE